MLGSPSLNQKQKEAVCSTKGPLLVIAGAGTGKTKVITHRVAHLISQGINPNQILAVTFTNKAAKEMSDRINQLAGFPSANGWPAIGTFHSIAADILRKHGSHIGIPQNFSILDEQQNLELVKTSIEELGLSQRQFRPSNIQNLISQKKSGLKENESDSNQAAADASASAKATADMEFLPKNLNAILEKYNSHLQELNALDFDDIIQKTVFLLAEYPEVLHFYQEKWPYIHIDEYQDTDGMQHRLVQLLSAAGNNICAVGDEDQSIYGFRGADFTNILNFEKSWLGTKTVVLERNYRSTQKILDAANAVISKNEMRREKNLFTKEKSGTKLALFEAENENEEADFVAKEIKHLLQKETLATPIAVLCRANFQFPAFEEAFRRDSLPYQTAGNQDALNGEKQPVRLMTVHAAKGLEFKHVFIPGLEKGLFPYAPTEEERRLFYVALTRSQEKIYLSYAKYRTSFGAKQINQPSQFLSDIPQNLLKWA